MTEHRPVNALELCDLKQKNPPLTESQYQAVTYHLCYGRVHNPWFMLSIRTLEVEVEYQKQRRAHLAALLRGEITIEDLGFSRTTESAELK